MPAIGWRALRYLQHTVRGELQSAAFRNGQIPVIFREIVGDDLGVGLVDRSTEGVKYFGDLSIPSGRIQERRVNRGYGRCRNSTRLCPALVPACLSRTGFSSAAAGIAIMAVTTAMEIERMVLLLMWPQASRLG
jgi:hypothetical protein